MVNNSEVNNNDSTISTDDWNSFINAQSINKLKELGEQANAYLRDEFHNASFFNLSLNEIFTNMVLAMTLIFQEILALNTPSEIEKRQNMSFTEIFEVYARIFLKDNRVIYVGTFFILLSMLFMLITITI